jgi:hypothetical protein
MKHITVVALMIPLGVRGLWAQSDSVKMTLSGTAAASTINLLPGVPTSEYQLAGKGTLGKFDLRAVSVSTPSPQPSNACAGPTKLYLSAVGGAGVFRFENGDLLQVNLTGGNDCIDFSVGTALCTRVFKITGGTGRFEKPSGGAVTLTMIVAPALGDASNNPVFFTVTAEVTGVVPKGGRGDESIHRYE